MNNLDNTKICTKCNKSHLKLIVTGCEDFLDNAWLECPYCGHRQELEDSEWDLLLQG